MSIGSTCLLTQDRGISESAHEHAVMSNEGISQVDIVSTSASSKERRSQLSHIGPLIWQRSSIADVRS